MTPRMRRDEARRQLDLQHVLQHTALPEQRTERVAEATLRAPALLKQLDADKEQLRIMFRDQFRAYHGTDPRGDGRPYQDGNSARALVAGSVGVLGVEMSFAAAIGMLTFALPPAAAIGLGVGITLALAAIMAAVLAGVVKKYDALPRVAEHTLSRWMVRVLIAWLLTIAGLLALGRPGLEDFTYGSLLFNVGLTILTLLSPALVALLLTLARITSWPKPLVHEYHQIESLQALIEMTLAMGGVK